ncbi:MAG TPA: putative metalloprotease CJM1_0395 family protein [Cyclobacteriaceae bacterium]|nr:putative metalloprotease CJM1_0395 family protein [Cyclobacteriaceae bacterium]
MEPQSRDSEFRNHEQSHIASPGILTKWGIFFLFTKSDGKIYAVGGEVSIDTYFSCPSNPQATLQKSQQIRAAPLAPADPSAQDRAVALSANALEAAARQELQRKTNEESSPSEKSTDALPSHLDLFV